MKLPGFRHWAAFGTLVCALSAADRAIAHPHVWVVVKAQVLAAPDGKITGIRHIWTFDEPFSTYATMGMDTDKDGKLSRQELEPLAKVNMESLHEYGFFTEVKQGKQQLSFADPMDYFLEHDGKALTLHFTLPVKDGAISVRDARMTVADPSFFVSFEYAKEVPVTVQGVSSSCKALLKPPAPALQQRLSQLSENFFQSMQSNGIGSEFATPVTFTCP